MGVLKGTSPKPCPHQTTRGSHQPAEMRDGRRTIFPQKSKLQNVRLQQNKTQINILSAAASSVSIVMSRCQVKNFLGLSIPTISSRAMTPPTHHLFAKLLQPPISVSYAPARPGFGCTFIALEMQFLLLTAYGTNTHQRIRESLRLEDTLKMMERVQVGAGQLHGEAADPEWSSTAAPL